LFNKDEVDEIDEDQKLMADFRVEILHILKALKKELENADR